MWEINQGAFDLLLARLAADSQQAGERYEELRQTLIYYFERHSCSTPDEQADETIDRVSKRMAEGEQVRHLPSYCYGTARHVLQEYWNNRGRKWTGLDGLPPSQAPSMDPRELEEQREESEHEEQRLTCMRRCLQSLPPADQELITQYTVEKTERKKLAAQRQQTLNALRLQVFHLRARLKGCEAGCLKKLLGG